MRFIKIIFWTLWRIWFYIVIAFFIVLLFPFLIISILREEWYGYFFVLARIWAKGILLAMGFHYKIEREQEIEQRKSYMIIANHTSMIDIMLMLAIEKNPFVFVGKKELAAIPLFGFFYKRTCILVDRNNSKSRFAVYDRAQKRLNQGLSICIFPEGGVPVESIELDEFKDGAFRLALEHQIPIVPMTFADNKKRLSYTFFSGSPGLLRAMVHTSIETKGLNLDHKKEIKDKARSIILNQLKKYNP